MTTGFAVSITQRAFQAATPLGGGFGQERFWAPSIWTRQALTPATLVTNGTLAGIGSINGPVVVAPAGTIGAGEVRVPGGSLHHQ